MAVSCERTDFECDGSMLRLRKNVADPKGTVLVAETYALKKSDIIELNPGDGTPNHVVYRKAELPKPEGLIPIRPISYFAADYVKWFAGEDGRALKRKEKRGVFEAIETALASPAHLSGYLEGAKVSERERLDFEAAIRECWDSDSSEASAAIVKALKEDKAFFEKCCDEVVRKGAPKVKRLSDEVAALDERLSATQSEIDELGTKRAKAIAEIEGIEARKAELLEEMAELERNSDALEKELEDSIALRVGLKAIGGHVSSGAAGQVPSIRAIKVRDFKLEVSEKTLKDALKRNLRSLGLTTTEEDVDPCGAMARFLSSALMATNILAIDRACAYQVADAISLARSGRTASRISIPADWGDVGFIEELIGSCDCGAVVLENVFDTVNESIMFGLRRDTRGTTIVLPVGALKNLRLVAPEAFSSMMFIHDDSLAAFEPKSGMRVLQCSADSLSNSEEGEGAESVVEDVAMFRREALKESDVDSSLLWNPVRIWDLIQKAPSKEEGDRVEQAMALLYPHFALICMSVDGSVPDEIDEMFETRCDKTILARRFGFDE